MSARPSPSHAARRSATLALLAEVDAYCAEFGATEAGVFRRACPEMLPYRRVRWRERLRTTAVLNEEAERRLRDVLRRPPNGRGRAS